MKSKNGKIAGIIGSQWFFLFTLLLFIFESSWLSLTVRFPMAFDEAFHFGLIQFFSKHLYPVITSQSPNTYQYGAIVQNPSFLYHYLMSFPYRLISIFTNSTVVHVAGLRLINVGLVVISLIVMRLLLRRLNMSPALTNLLIFMFAFTPIVTALSAQISYDNLLILSVSICLYVTTLFLQKLSLHSVDSKLLLILAGLCIYSSLIKFSFLPIFAALTAVIIWRLVQYQKQYNSNLLRDFSKGFSTINKRTRVVLIGLLIIGSSLFIRIYIVNIFEYKNPVPQCNQVLSVTDCKNYYAWDSNYNLRQYKLSHPNLKQGNIFIYSAHWIVANYFQIYGEIRPMFGLYYISFLFTSIVGLLGLFAVMFWVINFKKILIFSRELILLYAVIVLYMVSVWIRNYHDYLHLGQPIAISGRYLIPVLLYIYMILAIGLQSQISDSRSRSRMLKNCLALLIIALLLCFGGFVQYVLHITPHYGHLSSANTFSI